MNIDFQNATTEIILSPHIDCFCRGLRDKILENFKGHCLLASSGTTRVKGDPLKLVALSKEAILISAEAVNRHLGATSKDVWLNPLPNFHVGGLSIYARSLLSRSFVYELNKWSPPIFLDLMNRKKVTLTSLVPTQVYDLITHKMRAPKSLRALIVGGGSLGSDLYEKAKALDWPIIMSYGLTECASQVATTEIGSQSLKLLDHIQGKIDENGLLKISSKALFSAYVYFLDNEIEIVDPKMDAFFTTEDLATLDNRCLTLLGRINDYVKIGGEGVFLSRLESCLDSIKLKTDFVGDACLIAASDERLQKAIHLVTTNQEFETLLNHFNDQVMPYERIRKVHHVTRIPKTSLNKICKNELCDELKLH